MQTRSVLSCVKLFWSINIHFGDLLICRDNSASIRRIDESSASRVSRKTTANSSSLSFFFRSSSAKCRGYLRKRNSGFAPVPSAQSRRWDTYPPLRNYSARGGNGATIRTPRTPSGAGGVFNRGVELGSEGVCDRSASHVAISCTTFHYFYILLLLFPYT